MKERHVFHVYIKETDEHRYFGSKAALCKALGKRKIGVEVGYLNSYFCRHPDSVFENAFCVIRKGILERNDLSEKQ